MQFGAMEPRTVTAKKLNELVKIMEEIKAKLAEMEKEKPSAKKTVKKAEAEESAE